MKKNIRARIMTGQSLLLEDVLDWTINPNGLEVTQQETISKKVGDEMQKSVITKKVWFNLAGLVTFTEELVDA